jgi:hypothetical protein
MAAVATSVVSAAAVVKLLNVNCSSLGCARSTTPGDQAASMADVCE